MPGPSISGTGIQMSPWPCLADAQIRVAPHLGAYIYTYIYIAEENTFQYDREAEFLLFIIVQSKSNINLETAFRELWHDSLPYSITVPILLFYPTKLNYSFKAGFQNSRTPACDPR